MGRSGPQNGQHSHSLSHGCGLSLDCTPVGFHPAPTHHGSPGILCLGHCEYFMSVADMPSVLRVLCSCTCCVVPSDLPYLEQWQQSIKPPRGILLSNCTGHVSLEISYASGFSENPTHTSQCLDISRAVSHSRSWQCLDFRSILCLPSPHPAAAKIHTASHRLTAGSLLSPRSSLRDTKETFLNMIGFLLKWPWWGCSWALWTPSCQSIEFVFCFFFVPRDSVPPKKGAAPHLPQKPSRAGPHWYFFTPVPAGFHSTRMSCCCCELTHARARTRIQPSDDSPWEGGQSPTCFAVLWPCSEITWMQSLPQTALFGSFCIRHITGLEAPLNL